jgi:hypothetical protein
MRSAAITWSREFHGFMPLYRIGSVTSQAEGPATPISTHKRGEYLEPPMHAGSAPR